MKLPTIRPNSIQIKPIVICITCILFICLVGLSMISLKSKGFSLRPAARRLLGLKKHSPKFCNQLARREAVNWNYFYYYKNPNTQNSIIWCKVPKAGSTTLTKMFLRLAGSKNYKNNTRVHKLLRDFYPRLPTKVMLDKMKTTKSFLVVRDPFERILSAYRDKLESYKRDLVYRDGFYYENYGRFMIQPQLQLLKNSSRSHTNMTRDNGAPLRKEPTWNEFIAYLLKTPVSRFDEHWMPITKLCSPCNVQFDYIIKMENFESEIQKPLKDADITADKIGRSHITGSANRKLIEKYFKNLTASVVKKLYTKYKRDFMLFGYTPYKYFRLFKS